MKTRFTTLVSILCLLMFAGIPTNAQVIPADQKDFQFQPFNPSPPGNDLDARIQKHKYLYDLSAQAGQHRLHLAVPAAPVPAPGKSVFDKIKNMEKERPDHWQPFSRVNPQTAPDRERTVHFRGHGLTLDSSYLYAGDPGEVESPIGKVFYFYDDEERLIEEVEQYMEAQNYKNSRRILYEYDENGNLATEHVQLWNTAWADLEFIQYSYDDDGRLVQKQTESLVSFWASELREYVYNTSFSQPDTIRISRKINPDDWEMREMEIFELNQQGLPDIQYFTFLLSPDDVVTYSRIVFEYDGNGYLTEKLEQSICVETTPAGAGLHVRWCGAAPRTIFLRTVSCTSLKNS